jgi:hypothetical protein
MPTVVIIASTFPNVDPERAILSPAGCDVIQGQRGPDTALMGLTRDADAVIVQLAPLNAAEIDNMRRVKAIVRYGVGYDNIDVEAARRRHVPVCNVPDPRQRTKPRRDCYEFAEAHGRPKDSDRAEENHCTRCGDLRSPGGVAALERDRWPLF